MTEETWYSTLEAAARLGVSDQTIRRWVDQGEFPRARRKSPVPGSPRVIPESDIVAFEARRDAAA